MVRRTRDRAPLGQSHRARGDRVPPDALGPATEQVHQTCCAASPKSMCCSTTWAIPTSRPRPPRRQGGRRRGWTPSAPQADPSQPRTPPRRRKRKPQHSSTRCYSAFGANRIAWGSNLPAAEQAPPRPGGPRQVRTGRQCTRPNVRRSSPGRHGGCIPNRSFGPGLELGRVEVRARPGGDPGRQGHAVHGCGGRNPDASLTSTHTPSGAQWTPQHSPRSTGRSGTRCGSDAAPPSSRGTQWPRATSWELPCTVRMDPAGMTRLGPGDEFAATIDAQGPDPTRT